MLFRPTVDCILWTSVSFGSQAFRAAENVRGCVNTYTSYQQACTPDYFLFPCGSSGKITLEAVWFIYGTRMYAFHRFIKCSMLLYDECGTWQFVLLCWCWQVLLLHIFKAYVDGYYYCTIKTIAFPIFFGKFRYRHRWMYPPPALVKIFVHPFLPI